MTGPPDNDRVPAQGARRDSSHITDLEVRYPHGTATRKLQAATP
jgi:hypothetical protein